MSNSNTPDEFDIDALYKQGAKEQPSAELDDKIKAMAADHVSEEEALTERQKLMANPWYRGLSTAAVLVIVVHLFLEVKDQSSSPELTPMHFSDEMRLESKPQLESTSEDAVLEADESLSAPVQSATDSTMQRAIPKSQVPAPRAMMAPSPALAPAETVPEPIYEPIDAPAVQSFSSGAKERVLKSENSDFSESKTFSSDAIPEKSRKQSKYSKQTEGVISLESSPKAKKSSPVMSLGEALPQTERMEMEEAPIVYDDMIAGPDPFMEDEPSSTKKQTFDEKVEGLRILLQEGKNSEAKLALDELEQGYPEFQVPDALVQQIRGKD